MAGGGGGGGAGRIAIRTGSITDHSLNVSPDALDRNASNDRLTWYDPATVK
jgi:hypothetical protein